MALVHSELGSTCSMKPPCSWAALKTLRGFQVGLEKSRRAPVLLIPQTGTPGLTGQSGQTAVTEQLGFSREAQRILMERCGLLTSMTRPNREHVS